MAIALTQKGIEVGRQIPLKVAFRGTVVGEFRADMLVEKAVLLEMKAARALDLSHEAQLLNYLRATEIEVCLLLNFGPKPLFKRLAFETPGNKSAFIRVDSRPGV